MAVQRAPDLAAEVLTLEGLPSPEEALRGRRTLPRNAKFSVAYLIQSADGTFDGDDGSMSLDGLFQAVRASLQLGRARWPEVKQACDKLLAHQASRLNDEAHVLSHCGKDSHTLPNVVANVAECAQAFPDLVTTARPWSCCARYV